MNFFVVLELVIGFRIEDKRVLNFFCKIVIKMEGVYFGIYKRGVRLVFLFLIVFLGISFGVAGRGRWGCVFLV